jgi:hypothetical protein
VVGPASVSRRHERPSRNGRQPTEREVEAAAVGGPATSQGGIWIHIASSGRADEHGQRTVSLASLAWRALCLLADAPMLPGWDASGRGHWAQPPQDPRPLPQKAGEHTPSEEPVRPKADALGGTSPPTGCAAPALRCQVADSPNHKTARALPTLGGVEPLCHPISYRMALIIRLIIQTILLVPSGAVWTDEGPNVSRLDPTRSVRVDAEHPAHGRKIVGLNPTKHSKTSAQSDLFGLFCRLPAPLARSP